MRRWLADSSWALAAALLIGSGCGGDIEGEGDAGTADSGALDTGAPPDVGPPVDAPRCRAATETCNGRDDDCDERVDEGIDTATDPMNCGACGIRCSASAPECAPDGAGRGTCVGACAETTPTRCGLACVDTTTDLEHCGSCGNACPARASATTTCVGGSCGFTCASGYDDCDGDAANGCETPLNTLSDCGSCGTGCSRTNASETCSTGSCLISSCTSGYDNCDGADANGCEVRLNTLTNCGSCGTACSLANATATCSTGSCRISTCNTGFGDCNGVASDGCECVM